VEWQLWVKVSATKLGVVVQLGHEGASCPLPHLPRVNMVVLDSNGIHEIGVHFCGCALSLRANKREQLMRARWYPATVIDPQTCATYEVLKRYHLLNVVGGVNVHDFVGSLERLTNATEPSLTPVSYQL
jgi:CxC2 like cysteine cluster associated with KDZ transposases